jgi:hypothetical protein
MNEANVDVTAAVGVFEATEYKLIVTTFFVIQRQFSIL